MIAVIGGYGQGLSMRVPRSPEAGETVAGGVLHVDHGGKGSNQAVAVRRLKTDARIITALGDDDAAAAARRLWAAEDRAVEIAGQPTIIARRRISMKCWKFALCAPAVIYSFMNR
jgi:ribokinase